jgi:hypothetical protein
MSLPLKLYARREPTTDSTLLEMQRAGMAPTRPVRYDTVLYRDADYMDVYCRWEWWKHPPDRRSKTVSLNCYRWILVWVSQQEVRKQHG